MKLVQNSTKKEKRAEIKCTQTKCALLGSSEEKRKRKECLIFKQSSNDTSTFEIDGKKANNDHKVRKMDTKKRMRVNVFQSNKQKRETESSQSLHKNWRLNLDWLTLKIECAAANFFVVFFCNQIKTKRLYETKRMWWNMVYELRLRMFNAKIGQFWMRATSKKSKENQIIYLSKLIIDWSREVKIRKNYLE